MPWPYTSLTASIPKYIVLPFCRAVSSSCVSCPDLGRWAVQEDWYWWACSICWGLLGFVLCLCICDWLFVCYLDCLFRFLVYLSSLFQVCATFGLCLLLFVSICFRLSVLCLCLCSVAVFLWFCVFWFGGLSVFLDMWLHSTKLFKTWPFTSQRSQEEQEDPHLVGDLYWIQNVGKTCVLNAKKGDQETRCQLCHVRP